MAIPALGCRWRRTRCRRIPAWPRGPSAGWDGASREDGSGIPVGGRVSDSAGVAPTAFYGVGVAEKVGGDQGAAGFEQAGGAL